MSTCDVVECSMQARHVRVAKVLWIRSEGSVWLRAIAAQRISTRWFPYACASAPRWAFAGGQRLPPAAATGGWHIVMPVGLCAGVATERDVGLRQKTATSVLSARVSTTARSTVAWLRPHSNVAVPGGRSRRVGAYVAVGRHRGRPRARFDGLASATIRPMSMCFARLVCQRASYSSRCVRRVRRNSATHRAVPVNQGRRGGSHHRLMDRRPKLRDAPTGRAASRNRPPSTRQLSPEKSLQQFSNFSCDSISAFPAPRTRKNPRSHTSRVENPPV